MLLQRLAANTPSESYFKHTVYGLRFLFRLEGLDDKRVALPCIERQEKLPVVLSREEMKRLLKAPSLLKYRLLIGLLYDCGLRCLEVCTLQIKDIDLNRRMIHARQSKGKKDRYVPATEASVQHRLHRWYCVPDEALVVV